MLNLKLQVIANLVNKNDIVIDTCCDHAYLAIHLKKHKLCKEVYASDISECALKIANENIKKSHLKIKTFLSDGLKSVNEKNIDTVIIAGVGTDTSLKIATSCPNYITKFIISSNNNHYELRKNMTYLGYYPKNEVVVKEKGKFYPIILFTKEKTKTNKYSFHYGLSNNKEYFSYLLKKEQNIIAKIPKKYFMKRFKHQKNIQYLKHLI